MKKRFLLKMAASVLLLALLLLSLPSCKTQEKTTLTYIEYFDTVSTFVAYSLDDSGKSRADEILRRELQRYHTLFDIYNSYDGAQNIKSINDAAGDSKVFVDAEIIELLEFSLDMYNKTGGHVNVAMGAVLSLWHDARTLAKEKPEAAKVPDAMSLLSASEHCDISRLIIDKVEGSVYLADEQMSLDVGAVAKGYAAQKISEKLKNEGINDFLLNLGGNVVGCGTKPDGSAWSVGIQDPNTLGRHIVSVNVKGLSLVTSGTYQRYFSVGDTTYHHIIHPVTLMPEDTFLSVSVLAKNSAVADALSTSLFNMSLEDGRALVEAEGGIEAMWILSDGSVAYSSSFEAYIVGGSSK